MYTFIKEGDDRMIMELNGVNGQIELYHDKAIIKRKGFISKLSQGFFKGDKTIYLSQISSIQVKPGSMLTNGYIQFSLSGGNESTKGIVKATQDENTVMFAKKDNGLVENMKAEIEQLKNSTQSPGAEMRATSAADEIRKYKQLLDDGIISEDEFNVKKRELLG